MKGMWNCGICPFTEADLGKNRALASIQKLQELNNAVTILTFTEKLTKEHLGGFQAVVFTDIDLESAIEFDEYCHNHQPSIAFIKTEVRGLFGSVFCDFGPGFTVVDVDGEVVPIHLEFEVSENIQPLRAVEFLLEDLIGPDALVPAKLKGEGCV